MKKTIVAVVALIITISSATHAADPLDAVKQQYLAAAYEEALAALDKVPPGADPDEADKLRALCLLALNRRDEAGKALEGLALRRPLLKFDESESPKFVMLFREARGRVLGPATKAMYVAAKGSFDKGEFETAKKQFSELLALLSEPDLAKQPETADLKMLADGFAKLVDQQLERPVAPAATPPVAGVAGRRADR
jgi:tetratricopeptide (TPR) repeat protein